MNEYDCYVDIIKPVSKHSKNEKYNTIIPIFLNKMYHEYCINRNSKKYNLDNLYKKHLPLLYITLDQKYAITDKDNLILKNNIFEL